MTAAPTGPDPRTDAAVGWKVSRLRQAVSDAEAIARARDDLARARDNDPDAAAGK